MYAAHTPSSHQAHVDLSREDLVAVRETVWIIASFKILKQRRELCDRSSSEARLGMDGEKQNAWGGLFFRNHSAELKGT